MTVAEMTVEQLAEEYRKACAEAIQARVRADAAKRECDRLVAERHEAQQRMRLASEALLKASMGSVYDAYHDPATSPWMF